MPKAKSAALEEVLLLHQGVCLLPGSRIARWKGNLLQDEDSVEEHELAHCEVVVQYLWQVGHECIDGRGAADAVGHCCEPPLVFIVPQQSIERLKRFSTGLSTRLGAPRASAAMRLMVSFSFMGRQLPGLVGVREELHK